MWALTQETTGLSNRTESTKLKVIPAVKVAFVSSQRFLVPSAVGV